MKMLSNATFLHCFRLFCRSIRNGIELHSQKSNVYDFSGKFPLECIVLVAVLSVVFQAYSFLLVVCVSWFIHKQYRAKRLKFIGCCDMMEFLIQNSCVLQS